MSKKQVITRKTVPKSDLPKFDPLDYLPALLPVVALVPMIKPPVFFDVQLPTKELAYLLLALTAAAVAAWRFFRRPAPVSLSRAQSILLSVLLVFLLWQVVSLAWAPNLGYGLRSLSIWLGVGIFLSLRLREHSIKRLEASLITLTLILSLYQIIEYSNGNPTPSWFFNYGITAEVLATLLPFHLAQCLAAESRFRAILTGASAILAALCLCETVRRGAMAGAMLGLLMIAIALTGRWIKSQGRRREVSLFATIAIVVALQLGGLISPNFEGMSVKTRINDAIGLQVNNAELSTGQKVTKSNEIKAFGHRVLIA